VNHRHPIYTMCLKNVPAFLVLCLSNMNGTNFGKNRYHLVLKQTLSKTVQKVPSSPEICASTTLGNLKLQIEL